MVKYYEKKETMLVTSIFFICPQCFQNDFYTGSLKVENGYQELPHSKERIKYQLYRSIHFFFIHTSRNDENPKQGLYLSTTRISMPYHQ